MSKEKKIRSKVSEMYILPYGDDDVVGCGKTGGKKPMKGSLEMREKMARIRAMRGLKGKEKTGGAMKCVECVESGEGGANIPYGSIASVLASLVLPIVQQEVMAMYNKHRYGKKKNV